MHKKYPLPFPRIFAGFTLIELLFVIAILGVLSTTSILFYQQKMQTQKIEKTVAQAAQWMQAGIAYRLKEGVWPTDAQALITGKFIGAAETSNPWCTDKCYEVGFDQNEPHLFRVTIKLTAGGSTIRDAVAARLPYAHKPDPTTVVAVINTPLAALTNSPNAILVDVRPFHIGPGLDGKALFNLKTPALSHQSNNFAESDAADPRMQLGQLPNCNYPGKNYSLAMFPTISGYSTRYDTKDSNRRNYFQQAVFSQLEVYAVESSGNALLQIRARPQRTYYSGCFGKDDCLNTHMVSDLLKEIEIRGEVFFVCCKKNTPCKNPGAAPTTHSSQPETLPSLLPIVVPDRVRF